MTTFPDLAQVAEVGIHPQCTVPQGWRDLPTTAIRGMDGRLHDFVPYSELERLEKAHPPAQREPLTDEEILEHASRVGVPAFDISNSDLINLARAVLAAQAEKTA